VKTSQTVHCLPDPVISDQADFNGIKVHSEAFLAFSQIEKALVISDKIANLIKGKIEPVSLMAYYNNLLQEYSSELIQQIAAADNETRARLVKTLFSEIVRAVH
jgi:HD superfamily phosphohydrolase YqeK